MVKKKELLVRLLEIQPYAVTYQAMHDFTEQRSDSTCDELWLVEHFPVFSQGKNGDPKHLLRQSDIPVFQADRGGQVTYHGPGQQILYTLIDIRRSGITIRQIINAIEECVILTLASLNISAYAKKSAPGVYVNEQKICSLGLRVWRGCTLHGLALNINMDLMPFQQINPCGYANLSMTQISDFMAEIDRKKINETLVYYFSQILGFNYQFI